jgi:glycosyltransferase involved in cell wall biosynthesis
MNEGFSYEKFFSEKEETPPPKKLKGILSLLKESFRFYFSNFKFIMGVLGLPLGLFLLLFNISYISNFTSLKYSLFLPVFKFVFAIFSSLLLLTSSLALIQGFGEEISVRDAYKKGCKLLPAYSMAFANSCPDRDRWLHFGIYPWHHLPNLVLPCRFHIPI